MWQTLSGFSPERPVYVESESIRIGSLSVPAALIQTMRGSPCIRVEVPIEERVRALLDDYRHFFAHPETLTRQLTHLTALRGGDVVGHWLELVAHEDWAGLAHALLVEHYDPAYLKSLGNNYRPSDDDQALPLPDLRPDTLAQAARGLA